MRITFINVGYGDAILFQGENGYTALLDGGGNLEEEFAGDCFRIRAVDYLQKQGITHLNDVIISHIHEDHVCGLEEILRRIPTDRLYVSYFLEPFSSARPLTPGPQAPRSVVLYTKALNAYCRILQQRIQSGQAIHVLKSEEQLSLTEGLTATILGPKPASIQSYLRRIEQVFESESEEEVTRLLGELDATSNHTSLLIKFETAGLSLLAAADNCPREWGDVPIDLFKNVNVLKLPHHGQKDAVSEQYMQLMPLEIVVTTSASDRRYNSANPEVYERLIAMHQGRAPLRFLFSDEREYPPYFSQPDGFQAITLVVDSDKIVPEFIKI